MVTKNKVTKNKYSFDKNSHSVYSLQYHLVQCIKYRRKILDNDKIINELKERTKNILNSYDCEMICMETDLDHLHLLFKAKPQTDLLKFINNWKSATSKALRNKFPEIKTKLWKNVFWSDSYCLITCGQVTLDMLKKYVENQGK